MNKKNIVLFSDNCCGQNKNIFYIVMLWYCLNKFNFSSIEHKYLEKGIVLMKMTTSTLLWKIILEMIQLDDTPVGTNSANGKTPNILI